jgi:hypothetical protein
VPRDPALTNGYENNAAPAKDIPNILPLHPVEHRRAGKAVKHLRITKTVSLLSTNTITVGIEFDVNRKRIG